MTMMMLLMSDDDDVDDNVDDFDEPDGCDENTDAECINEQLFGD